MSASKERWLILRFTAEIGARAVPVRSEDARAALPADDEILPEEVSMELRPPDWDGEDLVAGAAALDRLVQRLREAEERLKPTKVGVFAIAPISLLAGLGRRLGDSSRYEIFQLLREPFAGWAWRGVGAEETGICFPKVPPNRTGIDDVVLSISLSQQVLEEEWRPSLPGRSPAHYEIKAEKVSFNIIQTRAQLRDFAVRYRDLMTEIKAAHGSGVHVHIFAGAPVSVSVELGRQLLQWAFASVKVYDWRGTGYARSLELAPAPPPPIASGSAGRYVSISGSGTVGQPERRGRGWDSPAFEVRGRTFEIGASAVTWGEWREVLDQGFAPDLGAPRANVDPGHPVTDVSWLDALRFANACSVRDGRTPAFELDPAGRAVRLVPGDGVRLPVELEWELAAGAGRPGTPGPFADTGGERAPARAGKPSEHGLYQARGNVWEWCLDAWDPEAWSVRGSGVDHDPSALSASSLRLDDLSAPRVVRGGGSDIEACLVDAHTRCFAPAVGGPHVGFRLVRPLRAPAPPKEAAPKEATHPTASPTNPPPLSSGMINMSTLNISGTNIQVVQHGTGFQDNRGTTTPGLPKRLDELLAVVASGQRGQAELAARLAAVEGELVSFGGSLSDLQGMIEPLWTRHVTASNRSSFEVFVRGLPDKAAFFALSQALLRLVAG